MVVTCKIEHWNYFKIISMFYFTCSHVWNYFKIFFSRRNYFSDTKHIRKYSWAAI